MALVEQELDLSNLMDLVIPHEDANDSDRMRFHIYKALHDAIINGDLVMVTNCAKSGISLNRHFDESINNKIVGITPLGLAAALNKLDILKTLIEFGADVNLPYSSLNTTPLMTSSYHGRCDIIKLLLQYGADFHAEDIERSTAIGYAFGGSRKLEAVKLLLQSQVDPNHKNSVGMDALLLASSYGNAELVDLLLRYGANPLSINYEGQTALHVLVQGKFKRIMKRSSSKQTDNSCIICQWAKDHREIIPDFNGHKTEFENADDLLGYLRKEMGSPSCKSYLQAVNKYRAYKREKAASQRKSGALLLCGSGKPERKTSIKRTNSITPASKEKDATPVSADSVIRQEKVLEYANVIKKLLKSGCQRDAAEAKFHLTALDFALMFNDVESAAVLVAAGTDHALKILAISEFYEAAKSSLFSQVLELVQSDDHLQLKKAISDSIMVPSFDHKDFGMTPLALLCAVASPPDAHGMKLKTAKAMIKKGSSVNDGGSSGRFPLTETAAIGDVGMAQLLISQGANLEVSSMAYNGSTPVLVAAMHSNTKMVQFLIESGAKIDKCTADGRNILFICYENNDEETMKKILSNKQDHSVTFADSFVAQATRHYHAANKNVTVVKEAIQVTLKKQEEVLALEEKN